MPLLGLALAKHVLRCFPTAHALLILAVNFFVTSLTLLGSYPFFYMGNTFFSIDNQRLWLTDVGCTDVGFVKSLAASTCTEAAFLMWISPAVLSVVCLVYAVVLVLLSLSIKNISPWAIARVAVAIRKESAVDRLHGTIMGALTQARQKESQKTVLVAAKALTAAMMFVMVAVYVAAALAPAGTKLSHAVISLCFMALLAIGLVLVSMFGAEELSGAAMQQPLVRLTFSYMRTDNCVTQAVCVFVGTPLFALYLALAAANQAVRRLGKANGWSFTKTLAPSDECLTLTRFASGHLAHVKGWPWASVLIMVNYLALAAWVLLYGSTLTYMGMAMLISWLKTMHWLVASLMFFAVGIVMFLLPPVPGLAVYLTAGILLTPVCEGPFGGEPYGFWIACLYAAFLAYLMKLMAQILQQKGIGERLGSLVYVRTTVGVNSRLIKAIRLILERKGLSLAKVCVLCGGPDWPTAVLTGILGCEVSQMLLGLSPIFMLTVPTSMAGAFQLRVAEDDSWAAAASMMLLLASCVQMVLGLLMLYFIEEVKTHQGEQLDAFEDDAEVAAQDAKAEAEQKAFEAATALAEMPIGAKTLLFGGTGVMACSAYMLMLITSECFEDFALTDDIDDVLCLHCPRAAIKPLGFVALGMLGAGILCLVGFNGWAARRVASRAAGAALL